MICISWILQFFCLTLLQRMRIVSAIFLNLKKRQSLHTWHHRFAHLNFEMIKQMERRGYVIGLQLSKRESDHMCVGCQFGKHQRASFPVNPV